MSIQDKSPPPADKEQSALAILNREITIRNEDLVLALLEISVRDSISVSELRQRCTLVRVGAFSGLEWVRCFYPSILASVEITLQSRRIGK